MSSKKQIWKNIEILVDSLQYFVIRWRVAMNIVCTIEVHLLVADH